jgi:hypothetical protein
MPSTGNRSDIGPTTEANALWLITQDPTAGKYAVGQADAAGSVPWHFFDPTTGSYLSVFQYAQLWADPRGGNGAPGGLTQQVDPTNTGWTPDAAHQPDLSYDVYLLTGDRYYLDQLNAQADFSIFILSPDYRNVWGYVDIVAHPNVELRSKAWMLREIDEASYANPNGSAAKTYFTQVSHDNWAYQVSQLPAWTSQQGQSYGWIPELGVLSGTQPNYQTSPWQDDYFASVAIEAAENGNKDAVSVLQWASDYLVGRFMPHPGWDTHDGTAYRNVLTDASGNVLQTWGQIENRHGGCRIFTWYRLGWQQLCRTCPRITCWYI